MALYVFADAAGGVPALARAPGDGRPRPPATPAQRGGRSSSPACAELPRDPRHDGDAATSAPTSRTSARRTTLARARRSRTRPPTCARWIVGPAGTQAGQPDARPAALAGAARRPRRLPGEPALDGDRRRPDAPSPSASSASSAIWRAARPARLADDDRPQAHRPPLLLDDARLLRRRRRRGADHAHAARAAEQRRSSSPSTYDQLFTMHGITMIFFFIIPMTTGAFGNYLLPLMIGARDMAFPRMNALSYWIFLASGIFLYTSFALGHRRRTPAGSTTCRSRAAPTTPGLNIDFYCLGLIFNGIASTLGRATSSSRSSSCARPACRSTACRSSASRSSPRRSALLFALPVAHGRRDLPLARPQRRHPLLRRRARRLGAALAAPLLVLRPPRGLHPDRARVRDRDRRSSRRSRSGKLVAFPLVAIAELLVVFIGFGVWAHHMFATGSRRSTLVFFAAATAMVVIPSAIQVFAWCMTIVIGTAALPDAAAVHRRLHRHLRDRRPHRDHVRRDPVRPAGDGHVLRRRPLPLHHLRRRRLPDLRRHVLLVPEGHRAACTPSGPGRSASGSSSSARTCSSSRCTSSGCSGCRGASTRTRAASAGRPTTCSRRSAATSPPPGSCCCSANLVVELLPRRRPPAPDPWHGADARVDDAARRRPSTTSRSSRRSRARTRTGTTPTATRTARGSSAACSCSTRATSRSRRHPVDARPRRDRRDAARVAVAVAARALRCALVFALLVLEQFGSRRL